MTLTWTVPLSRWRQPLPISASEASSASAAARRKGEERHGFSV